MKFVFLLACVLFLTACNTSGLYGSQYRAGNTGSQNQYVPVIISDTETENSNVVPAVSLCTREPYASYSNSPEYCGYAPVILP